MQYVFITCAAGNLLNIAVCIFLWVYKQFNVTTKRCVRIIFIVVWHEHDLSVLI